MKPNLVFSAIIALTAGIVSCGKSGNDVSRSVYVPLEQCRSSIGATICYDSLHDSRCPKDMYCVWAGIGIGYFTVEVKKTKHHIVLATYDMSAYRKDTTVDGYKFELLELNPYPGTSSSESRTAKLRVSK